MKWIPCKEQLPPEGLQVLAYGSTHGQIIGGGSMDICIWDGEAWWNEGGAELSQEGNSSLTIWGDPGWSHWMPLPKPPKDE